MFKVFGYNDLCEDFSCKFDSFFRAALFYARLHKVGMYVLFTEGFPPGAENRLRGV